MDKINIWEIGEKVNIKLKIEFIDFINNKIKEKFKTKREIHKELIKHYIIPYFTFKHRLKRSYPYFVDLEIIINLCKLLDISLYDMQENIIAYKTRRGWNYIENPKLPIKITPLFDMLIAHHIGDGNVINPKNGRKPYFSYRQHNEEYRNLYIKKIESVFGKLKYKNNYFNNKNTTKIYFPVVNSDLMFRLYNLNLDSFKSEIAIIPKEIMNKNWRHKLAFLIGIIIDEGNIDSNLITIRMKNKRLIEDLDTICDELSYKTSMKKGKNNLFCLYILSKDINKFYQDYQNLLKECPEINLGWKGEKIKEFINRLNKPKIYIKGNKNKVLNELLKQNLTVNELAKLLNMTRQGARYLIKELVKEGKVEIKSIAKFRNYEYGLN